MIATTELSADGGQRLAGQLAREIHGHLSRPRDASGSSGGEQLIGGQPEVLAGGELDVADRAFALPRRGAARIEAVKHLTRELGSQRLAR